MSKKKIILLAAGLMLLLVVSATLYRQLGSAVDSENLGTQDQQGNEQQEQEKLPAPDFIVFDANGREVKLSDFRGKPVVVNFWATWCGYCKSQMPAFEEVYREMGHEVHFLMINMTDGTRETIDSASAYIEDNRYTFPVYYDTQLDAMFTYGTYSLPVTYFFDAEGYGIAQASGAIDKDTLLRAIAMTMP